MATQDLLAAVERIRPLITELAPQAEANRQLSKAVYDAMHQAGLFGLMAPKSRGGHELPPTDYMPVFEALARIDSAAAWNLVMNQAIACYAAWMPSQGVDEVFRDGPPAIAGALNPPGKAIRVEGGWRVSGQVAFGSGCHHSQWLALPVIEMDGDQPKRDRDTGQPVPFAVFFRRSDAQILDTWHTLGMRGTGSTDYAARGVFVPDHLVAPIGPLQRPAPGFEGPLYRMWPLSSIFGEAIISVGVAAAAVDAGVALCRTKTPFPTTRCRCGSSNWRSSSGQGQIPGGCRP